MKSILFKLTLVILLLSSCSSYYASRVDGPYKGKVVDSETGQPIEGVVVLGTWYRQFPSPGGAVSKYYTSKEAVTDKNGNFEIKGLGRLVMSNIIPMDVLIFKAGYEYMGLWPWETFHVDELMKEKIRWEGDRAIIPLRQLTMEERRKQGTPSLALDAYYRNKAPLLVKEINKEEKAFNRMPYPED